MIDPNEIKNFDFQDESFRSFLRLIPAAVAVLDTEVHYLAVSDRWYTDYGIQQKDIIGKSHYDIFPEILKMPHWLALHQSSLQGAVHQHDEDYFPREDGTIQWVRWKIYPWHDKKGEIGGMIFYTEVITEEKEYQRSLEKANQNLSTALNEVQDKNRYLEEFAYITAHNLRAPATNLTALARLYELKEELEDRDEIISQIATSTQTLISTLDDLQQALVIRTNTDIKKDQLSFEEIYQSTLNQVSALLKGCKGCIEADFLAVESIEFPKSYMESIFINMVSNAIKYRSPERCLELKIGTYLKDDQVHLYFKDNGLGIDLEKYGDKLFKMGKSFHQFKDSKGIGLFIVKSQVEALKGKIDVSSEVNVGTQFTIIFN